MTAWLLLIASCIALTLLYPGRVLYFIRTIKLWLANRRTGQEEQYRRTEEIRRATAMWKEYLDTEHERLFKLKTLEGQTDQLRRSLAAGEQFLQSVSPDECPGNYKRTERFYRWAEKTIAEMDRREQR